MTGVEPERTKSVPEDQGISLLAYFQDTVRKDWNAHGDQHALDDRALNLALARVSDNAASLDRALQLAVRHVDEAQGALRDLLSQRLDALTLIVTSNEENTVRRVENARVTVEQLKAAEHHAMSEQLAEVRSQLSANLVMLERTTTQAFGSHELVHEMEQKAIEVAKQGQDTRLESMNEFRTQLREQASTFPTRDYVDTLMRPIADRLGALEQAGSSTVTRVMLDARIVPLETARAASAGSERTLTAVFAVMIFVVPIALHYLLPR